MAADEADGQCWELITGDVNETLSGPISIAKGRHERKLAVDHLPFLALISVNLGIINLFPSPGRWYLLFLAIEKIKGGPVSE